MKQFFFTLFLFASIGTVYAQGFEPGYYIDYSGAQHQGLIRIKKKDDVFRFKESDTSKSEKVTTEEAKYFKMVLDGKTRLKCSLSLRVF